MSLEEFENLLTTTGLPVTYRAWPEQNAPPMPFICYSQVGTNNFFADGKTYLCVRKIHVELYTENKQEYTEANLESVLSEFSWEKTETYIDTKNCYQILYKMEV